jgi:hypothetical protein
MCAHPILQLALGRRYGAGGVGPDSMIQPGA